MADTKTETRGAADSAPLTSEDWRILNQVDDSLAAGIGVYEWWKKTDAADSYRERLDLERSFNPAHRSFAFFDDAPLPMGRFPVLGMVQEMTFDFSRAAPQDTRSQIREFVMRYLLRVSDHKRPTGLMRRTPKWTSEQVEQLEGWGYSQVYYKLRGNGAVGKFPDDAQARIVDMRSLNTAYDWIVFQGRLFNLVVDLPPLYSIPRVVVPLAGFTEEFVVASADLLVCEEDPAPGVLGRYGYCCATLRDDSLRRGPLLWGPGRFYPGFAAFLFEVKSSGETVVSAPFAVNRPERVFGFDPDPVEVGTSMLDSMSFGLASRVVPDFAQGVDPVLSPIAVLNRATANILADRLDLSKEGLERYLLLEHFNSVYDLLAGAALTYCLVPDWTAPESELPKWVQTGVVV